MKRIIIIAFIFAVQEAHAGDVEEMAARLIRSNGYSCPETKYVIPDNKRLNVTCSNGKEYVIYTITGDVIPKP